MEQENEQWENQSEQSSESQEENSQEQNTTSNSDEKLSYTQQFNQFKEKVKVFYNQITGRKIGHLNKTIDCPYCFTTMNPTRTDDGLVYCSNEGCEEHITQSLLESNSQFITIIGPTNSTKSHFLNLLAYGLQQGVNFLDENHIITKIIGCSEALRILKANIRMLEEDENTLEATTEISDTLIIEITKLNSRKRKSIFLSFRDYKGESLESFTEFVEQSNIQNADAIIYLLDPLKSPKLKALMNGRLIGGTQINVSFIDDLDKTYVQDLHVLYESYLASNNFTKIINGKIKVPVAVTLTKFDLVRDIMNASFIPDANQKYNTDKETFLTNLEYHSESLEYNLNLIDKRLVNTCNSMFKNKRFFAMSPLGFTPDNNSNISGKKIKPEGIYNALIWILDELNQL